MNSAIHCIFKVRNWFKWLFLYISLKWTKLKFFFYRAVVISKADLLQCTIILVFMVFAGGYSLCYYHYKNYESVHMRILNARLERADETNRWLVQTLCDRDVQIKVMEGHGKKRGKR